VKVKQLLCYGLAAAGLAGCGGGSTSPSNPAARPSGMTRDVSGVSWPTAAGNRAAAARYAARLVSLARVPAGAKSLRSAPPNLNDPASGRPSGTANIDDARYYKIPMSFSDAEVWLKAFKPTGHLKKTGTSGGGGPGYQDSGIDFSGVTSRAWQSADLGLIIQSDSANETYLRVDAVVVWLDPVPLRDTATGPRVDFTVTEGCPATDTNRPDVTNTAAGLDREMLPAQAPVRALLCSYSSAEKLAGHRTLDGGQARSIAARIRQIPLSHVDGASYGCPADFGTEGYAAFEYADSQGVDIKVGLSGCEYISNGEITTMAGNAGNLFSQAGG
jgi:hypothetical protein